MIKRFEKYLGEVVYGGIDGVVTTFAVVAATAGAGLSSSIVIILGLANLVADGVSMGVSAYLSQQSERAVSIKTGSLNAETKDPLKVGVATFGSFVLVGFAPVFIYVFDAIFDWQLENLFIIAAVLAGTAFATVGWLKSYVADEPKLRAVVETLILGAIAALAAYYIGDVLERVILEPISK